MNRAFTAMIAVLIVLLIPGIGPAEDRWVWVDHAVDGDTIRLRNGRLVRYLGIDAPEIDHRTAKADPYAYAALAANRRLVDGKRIRLSTVPKAKDRYGRLLAHPFDHSGKMISRLLVDEGLAYCYPDTDDKARAFSAVLLSAQRRAMKEGRGIWSHPGNDRGPFIGNRRSKRFHTDGCRYGRQTAPKNRIRFNSRYEAHWQGHAPCQRCLPSSIKKGLERR